MTANTTRNTFGKAVMIAPFMNRDGHVGNYRCGRFIRWLSEAGVEVVVVASCGSGNDSVAKTEWGFEITVGDPFVAVSGAGSSSPDSSGRNTNGGLLKSMLYAAARNASYQIYNPDPGAVWARHAAADKNVIQHARGADWVISSSPPESAHVAARTIASRAGAKLVVDLRDGWLDEPLKPSLRKPGQKRMREAALEANIVTSAHHIFVTSGTWKKMLAKRFPAAEKKIEVLTNCYPEDSPPVEVDNIDRKKDSITLLHAGRFMGSSNRRRPSLLLEPLLACAADAGVKAKIILMGGLLESDMKEIRHYEKSAKKCGWSINRRKPVAKSEMLKIISDVDGLLLLSVSNAAIPSKLFDYIWARKPVLSASPPGSEVWNISSGIPQFFNVDIESANSNRPVAVSSFIESCASGNIESEMPESFSIETQKHIFLETLGISSNNGMPL